MQNRSPADRVLRVERCDLAAVEQPWDFAIRNAAAIDFHWDLRQAENPNFFNGRIRLLSTYSIADGALRGAFLETGFKEFLYWRETGEPEAGVTDAFGSAIIWSSDGAVLLCRQRPGHINSGLSYLPGGFIDVSDVTPDQRIDLVSSSAREVLEETGLGEDTLTRLPGFWLTFSGRQLSIGVEYHSHLTARELGARVMERLNLDPASELADVTMVSALSGIEGVPMAPFARTLLTHVLPKLANS